MAVQRAVREYLATRRDSSPWCPSPPRIPSAQHGFGRFTTTRWYILATGDAGPVDDDGSRFGHAVCAARRRGSAIRSRLAPADVYRTHHATARRLMRRAMEEGKSKASVRAGIAKPARCSGGCLAALDRDPNPEEISQARSLRPRGPLDTLVSVSIARDAGRPSWRVLMAVSLPSWWRQWLARGACSARADLEPRRRNQAASARRFPPEQGPVRALRERWGSRRPGTSDPPTSTAWCSDPRPRAKTVSKMHEQEALAARKKSLNCSTATD